MTTVIDRRALKDEALVILNGMASRKSLSFGVPCFVIGFIGGFCHGFAIAVTYGVSDIITFAFLLNPIGFGSIYVALGLIETGKVRFSRFWTAFSRLNYLRIVGASLLVTVWTLLWSLLFIIPGVVKAASYSLFAYILAENPELGPRESIEVSMMMMRGYKWQWFKLRLSLLGWYLLSCITFGLSGIWTHAYISTVNALFYRHVKSSHPPEFLQECITKVTAWRKCSDK